jgi:CPA2 family monovalent cation:H+ antiporter-2
VALLLFSIGLEFSFRRLKGMGSRAFLLGMLQIVLTLGVFALMFSLGGPFSQAVAMGAVVAMSSTAIVLRVLVDRTEIDSQHGRNALAILLTQDAAVVPLVLMVTILGRGGDLQGAGLQVLKTLAAAGGLAAVFYLLFYVVIPKALMTRGVFANRELVVLLAIVIGIGSSWSAHAVGLSPALGAFIAGMMLAESPFASQIRSDIVSLRTLFVTLFFTSIGMLADPSWFLANWYQALLWLVVVFIFKAVVIFIIALVFRVSPRTALATGITLAQIGEFSFVLATEGVRNGLIAQDAFDLMVTLTILSMFMAPYMAAYAVPLARRFFALFGKSPAASNAEVAVSPSAEPCGHPFIIGFGPAGQRVADLLLANHVPATVIELNPETAVNARRKGLKVHLVDATSSESVAHVGIKGTCLIIVTVPDPRAAREIIHNIRFFAPQAKIIARSRYHVASASLAEAGADLVVDEENTIGDELSREVMESIRDTNRNALGCALAGESP